MKVNRAVIAMALGLALKNLQQQDQQPSKNWCPDCNRRPHDPVAAIFCKNFEFHKQPTSHGAGVQS